MIQNKKTIIIIAGEASGDMHGAALVRAIKRIYPDIKFMGIGGDKMKDAGVELFWDVTRQAAIGIFEVAFALPRLILLAFETIRRIREIRPDAVIMIDYPDFNLGVAKRLDIRSIPIIYYISPQIWAWRRYRINTIARRVAKMLVFFDFERKMYERFGIDVDFVGHPIIDELKDVKTDPDFRKNNGLPEKGRLIGLLPGSRDKEFKRLWPLQRDSAKILKKKYPDAVFCLGLAPKLNKKMVENAKKEAPDYIRFVEGGAHQVMLASDCIIVASGTATVEAAFFGVPMVVVYRVNLMTWLTLILLIKIKTYAMCNIVAGKKIVPERVQWQATPDIVAQDIIDMIESNRLPEIRKQLSEVRQKLGVPGAADRAAAVVTKFLEDRAFGRLHLPDSWVGKRP
ncbi:MAG: lipid-A-disaccharide synthase [Planctomycetota bacterium]|jgi:lipid-A-disaccharide synthase